MLWGKWQKYCCITLMTNPLLLHAAGSIYSSCWPKYWTTATAPAPAELLMGDNLLLYTSCKLLHVRVVIERNETYCKIYRSAGTGHHCCYVANCCLSLFVYQKILYTNLLFSTSHILLVQPCWWKRLPFLYNCIDFLFWLSSLTCLEVFWFFISFPCFF